MQLNSNNKKIIYNIESFFSGLFMTGAWYRKSSVKILRVE